MQVFPGIEITDDAAVKVIALAMEREGEFDPLASWDDCEEVLDFAIATGIFALASAVVLGSFSVDLVLIGERRRRRIVSSIVWHISRKEAKPELYWTPPDWKERLEGKVPEWVRKFEAAEDRRVSPETLEEWGKRPEWIV